MSGKHFLIPNLSPALSATGTKIVVQITDQMGYAELNHPPIKGFWGVWKTDKPLYQAAFSENLRGPTSGILESDRCGSNRSQASYQASFYSCLSLTNGVIVQINMWMGAGPVPRLSLSSGLAPLLNISTFVPPPPTWPFSGA